MKNRILIIDGSNVSVQSFIVNPTLSAKTGAPIGMIVGVLKTLQKLSREMKPDRIIIVWDGPKGSTKRKAIFKEYKDGRAPIRRNYELPPGMTEDDLKANRYWQMDRLIQYVENLGISQYAIEQVEADDVMSYLVQLLKLDPNNIPIIVSTDKDFMQLCTDNVLLYRQSKEIFLNSKRIIDEYQIHPRNMAIARALIGDKSDNLDGVSGVGFKTAAKRFECLIEDKDVFLDDIKALCEERKDQQKIYSDILSNFELVERNYKIMQLYEPMLSIQDKQLIKNTLENGENSLHESKFELMRMEDGFGEINFRDLILRMKQIGNLNG